MLADTCHVAFGTSILVVDEWSVSRFSLFTLEKFPPPPSGKHLIVGLVGHAVKKRKMLTLQGIESAPSGS
jgi:hypothetical protein